MVIDINNRDFDINDLIIISKKNIITNIEKKNIFYLWKEKIDYLEKYYNKNYSVDIYDFYYFRGISDISLYLMKNINYLNITYGVYFNRFYNIKSLYDLYNPNNIRYGPIINTFSEYIKYEFFYNNKIIDYSKMNELDLTNEDYYYFIARLLFPTYYFDLFKNNEINKKYNLIINNINRYLEYIKEIIINIKKRHINMPFIDYIFNLL